MDIEQVISAIGEIPFIPKERGRELYEFVRANKPEAVLELGFAHGVSSCYIGAALKANGSGLLTTMDLDRTRPRPELANLLDISPWDPDIRTLLKTTELEDWVEPVFTPTSYNWELMHLLENTPAGQWRFDFAFIDGAHSWFVDGLAFFLVDRLLKPGGWVLFDDLDWTYGSSPSLRETGYVRAMPAEERDTPQIGKVFDLLVRPHPGYRQFRRDSNWGWARKGP
ncbi:hypothetical protein GCM10009850_006590 [Nonomuraea monospora]|uniref:Class I SAM-dependent methyltransferase n=1 Tax=Nonomuraea monospora TaxID=568818 RepID=A0ABN3C6P7_9ACTN